MTQDEIIRMAREACAPNQTFNSDEEWVERFAALVASHEREACAKLVETTHAKGLQSIREACVAAIRASGEK